MPVRSNIAPINTKSGIAARMKLELVDKIAPYNCSIAKSPKIRKAAPTAIIISEKATGIPAKINKNKAGNIKIGIKSITEYPL